METLFLRPLPCRQEALTIQIEPAYECDGSVCHQPIFREDGSLNFIPPHCHLIEQKDSGTRCYAIFCDFPDGHEVERIRSRPAPSSRMMSRIC
jgi:hypothetical protein